MADNSSILNLSNLNVYGDLLGSVLSPKVISVGNVEYGILNIENGGTGLSIIPNGQILIGQDGKIGFITGSHGETLLYSVIEDKWITGKTSGVNDIFINLEENPIFSIISSSDINNVKTFDILFKSQQEEGFLVSDFSGSNKLAIRKIRTTDLPTTFDNLILTNVYSSGSHQGNFIGNFDGNLTGNFIGTVSGTIIGDGSQISNLNASNISGINDAITNVLTGTEELIINRASISELNATSASIAGVFYGNFFGDGSELTNLKVKEIYSNSPNITISQDGEINFSETLSLSGSLSADEVYSNKIIGYFYGDGENITNISNESLRTPFITINNLPIYLGESAFIGADFGAISESDNLTLIYENNLLTVNMLNDITLNSISADNITAEEFNGTFYGNGQNITNINYNNITNLEQYIKNVAAVENILDGQNLVYDNDIIKLNDNVVLASAQIGNASGENIIFTSGTFNEVNAYRFNIQELSATYLYGNGSQITNILYDNIPGLSQFVKNQITGSDFINVSAEGVISLRETMQGVSYILLDNNLTGGGNGIVELGLNPNIKISSISASSFVSASKYYGDGSSLSGIAFSQLSGTPNFSQYATTSSLDSLSSSFSTFSSSINQTIIEKVNSIDLTKYATTSSLNEYSSSAASIYASKQQVVEVINSIPTDNTIVNFTAFENSFALYDIVALNSTGLVKASKTSQISSNAFGVVSKVSGTNVGVKVCGEIQINSTQTFNTGSTIWVGTNGEATDYNSIGSGNYATQIGYSIGGGKMVIVPRVAYRIA